MAVSQELKNALILIIAVSIALNLITPQIAGNVSANSGLKPLSRNVAIIEHAGSLGQTPSSTEPSFPGLFPESFREDRPAYIYPEKPPAAICGLCTCFTGTFDATSHQQLNQYTGAYFEEECRIICAGNNMDYILFSQQTEVSCDYFSIN
ncbi:MAG: hypothetical protein Q8R00_04280 [Candidatus Nanoarchaeia archaeon]|nr:hypothetical protein [Candidatus Nanoarchaeia archaeon]